MDLGLAEACIWWIHSIAYLMMIDDENKNLALKEIIKAELIYWEY